MSVPKGSVGNGVQIDGNLDGKQDDGACRWNEDAARKTQTATVSDALAHAERAEPLVVRMFGPLDVRIGGRPLPAMRTRTERDLLALLLLHCTQPQSREWVAEQLWPEAERAGTWLTEALSRIRSALGPVHSKRILRLPHGYLQIHMSGATVYGFDSEDCLTGHWQITDRLGVFQQLQRGG